MIWLLIVLAVIPLLLMVMTAYVMVRLMFMSQSGVRSS
jgi:hypothetical protein